MFTDPWASPTGFPFKVVELPLVTSGTDVSGIGKFLRDGETSYTAEDVVHYILADPALP